MTDDLRTRIADAMQARDQAATAGIDEPFMIEHATYEELADAVIEALPELTAPRPLVVHREWCVRHESGGGRIYSDGKEAHAAFAAFVERPPGVDDPGSGKLTGVDVRWVTDWKADDE